MILITEDEHEQTSNDEPKIGSRKQFKESQEKEEPEIGTRFLFKGSKEKTQK